ncbi:hypothetical protein V4B17_00855 [Bartonella sp. B23]
MQCANPIALNNLKNVDKFSVIGVNKAFFLASKEEDIFFISGLDDAAVWSLLLIFLYICETVTMLLQMVDNDISVKPFYTADMFTWVGTIHLEINSVSFLILRMSLKADQLKNKKGFFILRWNFCHNSLLEK